MNIKNIFFNKNTPNNLRTNNFSHVLAIFPDFGPHTIGGVQLSAQLAWEGLYNESNRINKQVALFCYGKTPERLTSEKITYVPSKTEAIMTALCQQWVTDAVLIWHIGLLKLLPFFRLRNVRVILFLHGIEVWKAHDYLTSHLLNQVDLFVSNSNYTWQKFLTYQPKLSTIDHVTVGLGVGEPVRNSSLSLPLSDPRVMLMISRLAKEEDYKGHREIIGVWRQVIARHPDAQLWIVGDGSLRVILEKLVREQGLENHVHFWGYVSDTKKAELINQCRCLAMPSRNEGFGLVYLEAMRLGRPCLVSNLDAGYEVVQPPKAGLAVDPSDSCSLVEAIANLLSDGPTWAAWSKQAQQHYEEHFTASHYQQRLASVIFSHLS